MQNQIADDKRHSGRARSFLRGEISYSNGAACMECTIRDISESGARIQVSRSVTLPQHFDLVIPQKGRHERARIIWINDGEIGVVFSQQAVTTPSASYAHSELEHRVHMLESELANMRVELNEIHTRLPLVKTNNSAA